MYKRLVPFAVVAFQMASALHPARAKASATQTLNPYSESILQTILGNCHDDASSMILNVPLSRKMGKTVQQIIDTSIAVRQKELSQQEQVLDAQIQQRLQQLRSQVKDKKKIQSELRQIDTIIATGKIDGKQIDFDQLASIKKSRDDIRKLEQDPNYLMVMAKEASKEEGTKIRTQFTAFKQKMTTCGCIATTLQKQYTEQEFLRRSLDELQSGPAISKDWQAASQICKAPKSE